MKIAILANSNLCFPTYDWLKNNHELVGIGITEEKNENAEKLQAMAFMDRKSVQRFTKERFNESLEKWLTEIDIDVLLILTFPFKVSQTCASIPTHGIYNVHFAPLPNYRGAAPLFWLIKNRESEGAICIHKITEEFDKGPIAKSKAIELESEDTLGMHLSKLSLSTPELIKVFLEELTQGEITTVPQKEEKAHYWPRPGIRDFEIDWNKQNSNQIKALIKATNPHYSGAITGLRSIRLNIIEVTSATAGGLPDSLEPGTIVKADEEGLFVYCKGQELLRIDIVLTDEGYITGHRLIQLGIKAGEKFI